MKKLVFTLELMGGIGNQLFQLSAGLLLKRRLSASVSLDLSLVNSQGANRKFTFIPYLKDTSIEVCESNQAQLQLRRLQKKFTRDLRSVSKGLLEVTTIFNYFIPQEVGFDDSFLKLSKSTRVNGYFQSFKFADSQLIKDALNLEPQSDWAKEMTASALESNPISVHLRRGDYLKEKDFGLLSMTYYRRALGELDTANREIWLFSDDFKAAQLLCENLNIEANCRVIQTPSYVHPLDEILILSHCQDSVIANSTFSWWGAFLNQRGGTVIAPDKWFKAKNDPIALIPPNWRKIPSDWE